jgi:hypothetical protein
MADSGGIVKWVLIGGAAYLIYTEFIAPAAAAPAASGAAPPATGATAASCAASGGTWNASTSTCTPAPAPPPSYQYVPPTTVQQLQTAAAGVPSTLLNADNWNYYWVNTLKKAQPDADKWASLFFPNGRPSDPSQNPMMTAAQYVAALSTQGISGLGSVQLAQGRAVPLFVPLILNPVGGRPARSRYRRLA